MTMKSWMFPCLKFPILIESDYVETFYYILMSNVPLTTETIPPSQPIFYLEWYPKHNDQYTRASIKRTGLKQDDPKFNNLQNLEMKLLIMISYDYVRYFERKQIPKVRASIPTFKNKITNTILLSAWYPLKEAKSIQKIEA